MPDDLDDMIRGAMKVLDEETPSGYFDAAPNQILARLEDGSMQHGSSGMTDSRGNRDPQSLMGPPVTEEPKSAVADRDEDSGLHDIRNLAQSTKQRLSSKRQTVNPPISDDDALTAASGSWKNIALPQPAKMVALPELEDLPSKQEVLAAQKAAKARKDKVSTAPATKLGDQDMAPAATASLAAMPVTAADTSTSTPTRAAFSLPSMERSQKSKGPLFAVIGLGVAAAAAGVFFMSSSKDQKASAPAVATADQAASKPMVEPVPAAAPTPAPAPVQAAAAGSAAEPAVVAPEEPKAPEAAATTAAEDKAETHGKRGAVKAALPSPKKTDADAQKVEAKPDAKDAKAEKTKDDGKAKGEGEGEPSFDALLKEAGVDENKKEQKPKLDKKSLSGDDFKQGMAAVNGKATGCYQGTQGTAIVKLTIAPSGKVTKASVSGAFAGKPEAACVEAAVKAASFPPWDGGPQTFNYSYMLSD